MIPEIIQDLPEVHPGSAGGAGERGYRRGLPGVRELAGVPVYGAAAAGYATAAGGRCPAAGVLIMSETKHTPGPWAVVGGSIMVEYRGGFFDLAYVDGTIP